MKTMIFKKAAAIAIITVLFASVLQPAQAVNAQSGDKINISLVGKYDSADTAAIREIDLDQRLIRFRNHATGKTYTLNYDNTSMMYDARGTVLSAALLEVGQIVDVTFLKSTKHITTLDINKDAWVVEDTRDHDLVRADGTSRVHGDTYKLDARTLVMADGDLALAEDVLSTDRVTVSGIGKDVYSVVVTGGHGYVSLSSDTVEDHSLVGAWFELDNEVIYKISPNMLLSAPEGDYTMQILGNGANYQSPVSISRNQETVVDTSNVTITKPKEGLVTFEIIPSEAEVFVDGKKVLTDVPQSIRYGYHALKISAEGYVTQDRYLKVGTPKSVVRIELEKDSTASSSGSSVGVSSSDVNDAASAQKSMGISKGDVNTDKKSSSEASKASTVSDNSSKDKDKKTPNKVIKGHKIYVDAPYGAEVYFDGNYIGVVPTSFTKVSGTHEVILKKDGYETKSYRISIDAEETDLNYSFPELKKIKKDEPDEGSKDSSKDDSSKDGSSASDASSEASSDDSSSDASSGSSDGGDSSSASSEVTTPPSEGASEDDKPGDDEGGTDSSSDKGDDAASTASGE